MTLEICLISSIVDYQIIMKKHNQWFEFYSLTFPNHKMLTEQF